MTLYPDFPERGLFLYLFRRCRRRKSQIYRGFPKRLFPAVRPGQSQQAGHKRRHLLRLFQDHFQSFFSLFLCNVVHQRVLCLGTYHGDGRPQFMGSVRCKLPFFRERFLQAGKHMIERIRQLTHLPSGTLLRYPAAQVRTAADLVRGSADLIHRKQRSPGDRISHQQRHRDQQRAGDHQQPDYQMFYRSQRLSRVDSSRPERLSVSIRDHDIISSPGLIQTGKLLDPVGLQRRALRKTVRYTSVQQSALAVINAENHASFIETDIFVQFISVSVQVDPVHKIPDHILQTGYRLRAEHLF